MPPSVPLTISPVSGQEIWLARELTPGAPPSSLGLALPVTSFKPSNKPVWLDDESYQGVMGDIHGVYQGPRIASWDAASYTLDGLGHMLYNLLGDYTATGTTGQATTLTAAVAAGATTATVAAITGMSSGSNVQLGVTADGNPEIVTLSAAPSGTTITFTNTPARFAHASGKAATVVTAPYTHVFALLNGSTGAMLGPGQPPSHCWTHMNGISTNGGDQYAYACASEVVITGNAEKLLSWTAKGSSLVRQAPASQLTAAAVSTSAPIPSWRTETGWGGTVSSDQIYTVAEHTITLSRAVKPLNTESGSQNPYVIARGKQSNTGKITIGPAIDDTSLTALLANTQPQLQFITSNGLSGSSLASLQVDILLAALDMDDISDGAELFGYDPSFKCVHTAATANSITTTGASGGQGAVKCTLVNAVPTY